MLNIEEFSANKESFSHGGTHRYTNHNGTPKLDKPFFTIVTSTFNSGEGLKWTADSIRCQTFANIQWIVADGGSSDQTLDIIRNNEDIIDYWFSAKDSGIYDAWNKALIFAQGDWVQFIGAGDELSNKDVLNNVEILLRSAFPKHNIAYGRVEVVSERKRTPLFEVGKPWSFLKGRWEMGRPALPVHPEVFHHRTILNGRDTFDTRFKIAGDSHLLLKHIFSKDPLFLPFLIDRMPLGGLSTDPEAVFKVREEIFLINKDLGLVSPVMHKFKYGLTLAVKRIVITCVPAKMRGRVIDWFRVLSGRKKIWTVE
ncbi:glycosyltransferase [Stutzerimonas xanthomarina]|uniref:Glycosyltransferase n=1 Tax=Stutzerimonas xanthomarina TaxID=271420 RepID=A0A427E8N8_9GAMM|nr:glycosyltransferase family 2 protein [Stutzerimonas xanthomarina]RRV12931.1 glycosyltransferase [Stutzerimonas xanthomarina]